MERKYDKPYQKFKCRIFDGADCNVDVHSVISFKLYIHTERL